MYQEGRCYEIKSKKLSVPVKGTLFKIGCGVLVFDGVDTPVVFGIRIEDVEWYKDMGLIDV